MRNPYLNFMMGTAILFAFLCTKAQAQCEGLNKKEDKFEGIVSFRMDGLLHVSPVKYIEKGKTSFYLSLTTTGSTVNVASEGVYILFEDGTKIIRKAEEVDVEAETGHYYGDGDFEYSSFVKLTPAEVVKLKLKRITDFKLFIYEQSISSEQAQKNLENIKCVFDAK